MADLSPELQERLEDLEKELEVSPASGNSGAGAFLYCPPSLSVVMAGSVLKIPNPQFIYCHIVCLLTETYVLALQEGDITEKGYVSVPRSHSASRQHDHPVSILTRHRMLQCKSPSADIVTLRHHQIP